MWPACCLEQECCPCQWTSDGQCSCSTTAAIHTTKIRITTHKSGKIQSKNVRHLFWCSGSPAFYTTVCCTARLISLPSFQHVFSCPFAPQEVQLSWSHGCQQTQCNPLKYHCSTTPNPCMCLTHGDESNSNPEKAVVWSILKTEVCKLMPQHVGLSNLHNRCQALSFPNTNLSNCDCRSRLMSTKETETQLGQIKFVTCQQMGRV